MQNIGHNGQLSKEFYELLLKTGHDPAIFGLVPPQGNRVMTAVAKSFQMIGSGFVGGAFWLKDRATDSFSYFWGTPLDNTLDRIFDLDREKVLRRALLLAMPEQFKAWETPGILIYAPAQAPAQQRAEMLKARFLQMTLDMRESDRVDLIQAVASILGSEKDDAVGHALLVITQKMKISEKVSVLRAVANIPDEDREQVVSNVLLILESVPGLKGVSEVDTVNLIETIAGVPANERNGVMASVLLIIPGMGLDRKVELFRAKVELFRAIAKVPAQARDQFVTKFLFVVRQDIAWNYTVELIRLIASIPVDEIGDVIDLALELIIPRLGASERKAALTAVLDIPARERRPVIGNALRLMPQLWDLHNTWNNRLNLIQAVLRTPGNERDEVVDFALTIINLPAQRERMMSERMEIFTAVANVPAQERQNVMEHLAQVIDGQMWVDEIVRVIVALADVPAAERPFVAQQFIQEREGFVIWRREGFVIWRRDDFGFAPPPGVNVHDGDRDQRVVAAINLLRERQGQISKVRMTGAVQEFTKYLDEREMNSEDKRLAQHALQGPRDTADFGPLINGSDTIPGLGISGEEMIARLWIFASGLTELEQAMAKEGIISALKDSYNVGRVCQKGKVQRLIVSVLQGRLADINIELEEGMQVAKEVAAEMFFSLEAHQAIRELPPLIEAANRFCDENPLVNRDEFLQLVEDYAEIEFAQEDAQEN